jgi:4-aminobutyrate aminotransferase-like enzyme
MTVGKGIGGGLALSAVVGREAYMRHWAPGTHTSTFMGDAVNLAAGSAAIGVLRDERLADARSTLGARPERPRPRLSGAPHVGEIRGLGLFTGIEIVTDRVGTADPARYALIRRAPSERRLLGAGGPPTVSSSCARR